MKRKPLILSALLAVPLVAIALLCVLLARRWLGAGQEVETPLPPGNIAVPHERQARWNPESEFARTLFAKWAARPLPDALTKGKGDAPRLVLARLLARRQVPETNRYLQTLKPWGISGTSGWLNPHGDYDFNLVVLTTILWRFGAEPDRLYPATTEHLLRVLLTEDGGDFRSTAPRTLGLARETENHLLMTEGSRYLKNRWLSRHGDTDTRYDNDANGMESKLLAFLGRLQAAGLYEFNSQPYVGYTLTGLLNLEAFGSDRVRIAARDVLDELNGSYALGSYGLRHFPPFRRRYEYAGVTSLTVGYQTAMMKAWLSFAAPPPATPALQKGGETHAVIAAALPYRPPDRAVRLLFDKGPGYFVQLGHGPGACPEIYSAGPGFLLSAGGADRGSWSQVVARPIVLLLDDGAIDLADVFHLAGPGGEFRDWNDTGVFRNFACAAGPVAVPARYRALAQLGPWRLFAPTAGVLVAVYSAPDLGLLALFPGAKAAGLLDAIARANPDDSRLRHAFAFPSGPELAYDPQSPHNRWVMTAEGGRRLDRNFDSWPLLAGQL